jgi:tRNA pseudouridine55 synthase
MNFSEGILPVFKPKNKTSFSLVGILRKLTQIRTIGHAGTLDPFADGVMVLLIGKRYTQLSNRFLHQDKEYLAEVHLGITTDTYDTEGKITEQSSSIPTQSEIEETLSKFQGTILQTPPMFSAKKIDGKKLYELARKGITVEREAVPVTLHIELIDYAYPHLTLKVQCSKGTYLRSLAYDIGLDLGCGAHLSALTRTRSGSLTLKECCDGAQLMESSYDWKRYLIKDDRFKCSSLPTSIISPHLPNLVASP